jgi:hypothetical protein
MVLMKSNHLTPKARPLVETITMKNGPGPFVQHNHIEEDGMALLSHQPSPNPLFNPALFFCKATNE